ncbi:hypothetical protein M430DRAFT_272105, partial [Amorphotheca resinae ATCC 22711]
PDLQDLISTRVILHSRIIPKVQQGGLSIHFIHSNSKQIKSFDSIRFPIRFISSGRLLSNEHHSEEREREGERGRGKMSTHTAPKQQPPSPLITHYLPPSSPLHILTFILCLLTFILFLLTPLLPLLSPPSPLSPLSTLLTPLLTTLLPIIRLIRIPVLIIHAGEAWWMSQRLEKEGGLRRGESVWWMWTLSAFLEGWGALVRVDGLLKRGNGGKMGKGGEGKGKGKGMWM